VRCALHLHVPKKLFFRIGEVASVLGVQPHVIRFWEREFHQIRPRKTTTNQRRYTRSGVLRIALVRYLLHGQGNSLAGAKTILRDLDMTDEGVEEQLSSLMGSDASVGGVDPGGQGAAVGGGHAMRKEANGSFLQERERLQNELKELRVQCRTLVNDNKVLCERMDRHEDALLKMRTVSGEGMKKILQLLDENRREG